MQYDNSSSPSSDVDSFAEEMLGGGDAISENQAQWIATIMLDPALCLEARLILAALARRGGPDFHPGNLTPEEISQCIDEFDRTKQRVSLLLCEPAGRA
jgi:hypothetical protein